MAASAGKPDMFVDVSTMTAREIQRLGHEDDEGPVQRQWTSRRSAGSGHSGYSVSDVWGAACHAVRSRWHDATTEKDQSLFATDNTFMVFQISKDVANCESIR